MKQKRSILRINIRFKNEIKQIKEENDGEIRGQQTRHFGFVLSNIHKNTKPIGRAWKREGIKEKTYPLCFALKEEGNRAKF